MQPAKIASETEVGTSTDIELRSYNEHTDLESCTKGDEGEGDEATTSKGSNSTFQIHISKFI